MVAPYSSASYLCHTNSSKGSYADMHQAKGNDKRKIRKALHGPFVRRKFEQKAQRRSLGMEHGTKHQNGERSGCSSDSLNFIFIVLVDGTDSTTSIKLAHTVALSVISMTDMIAVCIACYTIRLEITQQKGACEICDRKWYYHPGVTVKK